MELGLRKLCLYSCDFFLERQFVNSRILKWHGVFPANAIFNFFILSCSRLNSCIWFYKFIHTLDVNGECTNKEWESKVKKHEWKLYFEIILI